MGAISKAWIVALALLVASCGKAPPNFQGIDVTGADWGRDFSLRDPDGQVRKLVDFRGKYVLLFFGYTTCPDVCPTALARALEVRKLLGQKGSMLQVIFVTVDPERDTPALLRDYTSAFDASFLGLYGDSAETASATKEFKVFVEKIPTDGTYTVNHTALSYIFDPSGRLRLVEQHTLGADAVAADLRKLMRESS